MLLMKKSTSVSSGPGRLTRPLAGMLGKTIDRRTFLRRSGIALGAGAVASQLPFSMVEEAQARRAPSQQWVETFAQYYTPAMMAMAVLIAVVPPLFLAQHWATWFYRALVVLVIACPCALVIATPVSIVSALTAAMRQGATSGCSAGGCAVENRPEGGEKSNRASGAAAR